MDCLVSCRNLRHSYGKREVLHGIDFEVGRGGIVGLLGKNGAGKSTTINILMGFLRPDSGDCSVLGHPSHAIPPAARQRISLLHEGFVQYDFMTIGEIERYYAPFYPNWDSGLYFALVDRLGVPRDRKISRLSCGQRSQVTLGLLLAQCAELMILDDYSLGLDVGYRRLFLEFLRDYVDRHGTTVLLTSHIVQELDDFLDELIVIQHGEVIARSRKDEFVKSFFCYRSPDAAFAKGVKSGDGPLFRVERGPKSVSLYSFAPGAEVCAYLEARGVAPAEIESMLSVPMGLEDAFVGLTGMYEEQV